MTIYNILKQNVTREDLPESYIVFRAGGERDGETLAKFTDAYDAIDFANKYEREHADEFPESDDAWEITLGIVDECGNPIEW